MSAEQPGVNALRGALHGQVVLRGDPGYDTARKVWNGAIDSHPAMIVYCADAEDVAAAVRYARSTTLALAVRSGGHNLAGLSTCDDGIVIDLSRMKRIDVDADRRIARAEAGLNLGEFDQATLRHGLATTMGINGDTGIAGLTLGGGFGKLGRKFGLSCDNVEAVEIVTADGLRLVASEHEHPDLFWGVRGGGGNFGIVTAFRFRLHPVPARLPVCSVLYAWDQADEAMRHYDTFARSAPDEIAADAALVTQPSGERFFSVSACYVGAADAGQASLRPLLELGHPVDAQLDFIPYLQMQSASDALFPRGRRYYWKAQFMKEIEPRAVEAILDAYAHAPSAGCLLVFQHVGGAIARVPEDATPYVNRSANFDCFPLAIWDDPADDVKHREWARAAWESIHPYSTGGVYANNLGIEGNSRVRAAYGANYQRLVAVKRQYDPDNVFRLNQNIDPR
ncbi:FAD-binding oxidoreductase [Cupriavidus sp. BIS7]|uniref:FAD-binding oxidoreductase n=1 Tax=Cupriavidus sp. BIS7 TaxID=1217718 RepID=UPI0002F15183|nr:FAD-binding oxidoreductase [Cupriavidus sp. BIS7]